MDGLNQTLERNYQIQAAIGSILELSVQPLSLEEQLGRVLDLLLDLPWIALEQRGCIFLADESNESLRMVAHRAMADSMVQQCARVPFGSCLCGRVAQTGELLFTNCVDSNHERRTENMAPHGHYCVPVTSHGKVLAVVTLYVRENHRQEPFETEFLKAVANTLSGLIERRRAEEALQQANTRLERLLDERTTSLDRLRSERALILDAVGEAVCGVDRDGIITFVNPAGAKQTGYAENELIGHHFHDILHHSHADGTPYPREECAFYAANERGERYHCAHALFWRKGNQSFPVEYVATPLRSGEQWLGTVVVFRDISERLQIERQKEDFVSTVSHELRTPLTSIRGSLGLLESGVVGALSEQAQEMVEIARSSTDRLIRLINDILDLEKYEAGKVELIPDEVRPGDVVTVTTRSVSQLAREAELELIEQKEEDLPLIRGERDRLVQVLTNLLANAIRFSPAGSAITIACMKPDETAVRFSVRDAGPGISHEMQQKLFQKFQQLGPAPSAKRRSGSGLGLAISRAIVELHGGTIGLESEPGKGSTFYFTVPVVPKSTHETP
jgi:PAS domain S-box-containing protein